MAGVLEVHGDMERVPDLGGFGNVWGLCHVLAMDGSCSLKARVETFVGGMDPAAERV